MTLRTKALLIVGLSLIFATGLIYLTSRFTFIRGLEEIEKRHVTEHINQAIGALAYLTADLEADTADWASRDDTYAFIEDGNQEYIQSNLVDDTFVTLKLNLVLYVNSSGNPVFARAFNLENEQEVPVPPDLLRYFTGDNSLIIQKDKQSIVSGIIPLKESPMLVTSQPILTSNGEGPSRGTLVFGRYFDFETVNELSRVTLSPIQVEPVYNLDDSDFKKAYQELLNSGPIYLNRALPDQISGYTLLNDINDRPVFIMRIDLPRDTYQLGQAAVSYYILAILGLGAIVAVLVVLIVQKQILSRFAILIRGISNITAIGDASTQIVLDGRDELNVVADTINGMLGALRESASEIRASEERYRDLFENTTDIILSVDPDGRFLYVNDAWHKALGYNGDDIEKLTLWDIVNPDSLAKLKQLFQSVLSGEPVNNIESVFITRTGRSLDVEGNAGAQIRNGKVVAVRGIFHDVSERKMAVERLVLLYENERHLRQQLEEEIKKRIEFSRALVHELKTPITPIIAAAELLLEEVKGEQLTRLAQSIERGAFNLNQRIDELLDLARGEINALQLDMDSVDMNLLLKNISEEIAPLVLQFGQSLDTDIAPSLPEIVADKARLRQVVMNLLNNACKYTPKGGKITLKARQENDNLIVEITDTGLGISREDQVNLFEPYYRRIGDRERLSGLGLGLALSKRLVEMHGGRIWVNSRQGEGSTFGFSIPISRVAIDDKGDG